jgi:hypothetical protein
MASAHSHNRRVRGSRLPISSSIAVSAAPPTSARSVAIMIGDVCCNAESVTGYTIPAATIDTAKITETGNCRDGSCLIVRT